MNPITKQIELANEPYSFVNKDGQEIIRLLVANIPKGWLSKRKITL
jgi:hypothetical protein